MDGTKDDKSPICAVPETGENHGDKEIARGLPLAMRASAERNIQIITKPGTQADVPATPEILKTIGEEGLAEIDHKVETQQLSAASGNIAVTAEIPVDLPGECVGPKEYKPEVCGAELSAEDRICQNRTIVCDHALADETRENQHYAIEKSIGVENALPLDLRKQMPWPLYRTGYQVREQTDEQTIIEERSGSLNPAFIYVHDVGDFLKGVKRNARWKKNANQRQRNIVNAQPVQSAQERPREEIEILEDPKNREIQDEGKNKPLLSVRVRTAGGNFPRDQKIHAGAANHEHEETPVPTAVEKVASEQEENVLGAVT